jgi:preprotein translocase subunit YajC
MDLLIPTAHAQAAGAPQGDPLMSWLLLGGMFVLFYFLLIRPQQKRAKEHKQLVDALKPGDEVVTGGGVLGRVSAVTDQFASVELAPNVVVKVQRHSIVAVLPKGTLKSTG